MKNAIYSSTLLTIFVATLPVLNAHTCATSTVPTGMNLEEHAGRSPIIAASMMPYPQRHGSEESEEVDNATVLNYNQKMRQLASTYPPVLDRVEFSSRIGSVVYPLAFLEFFFLDSNGRTMVRLLSHGADIFDPICTEARDQVIVLMKNYFSTDVDAKLGKTYLAPLNPNVYTWLQDDRSTEKLSNISVYPTQFETIYVMLRKPDVVCPSEGEEVLAPNSVRPSAGKTEQSRFQNEYDFWTAIGFVHDQRPCGVFEAEKCFNSSRPNIPACPYAVLWYPKAIWGKDA